MPAEGAAPPTARQRQFEQFAAVECSEDPLYVALCRLLALRPAALALLDAAPPIQRRPNLLLAALHERVLAGAGGSLSEYFPGAGGRRAIGDGGLPTALDALLDDQRKALAGHCATRSIQTNEIGRCAVLWPALAEVAARRDRRPLALLDFGCSAGLNLGVDRYGYRIGGAPHGAAIDAGTPMIDCHVVAGRAPPRCRAPTIALRCGIDPEPVDVHDEAAMRWLRACLWPYDQARLKRFDQAVAIARAQCWPLRREADCSAAIEPWLDSLPAGMQPVVFNSWVLSYFDRSALARHIDLMHALVQRRGLAWLSAEASGLALGAAPLPGQADDRVDAPTLAHGTQWWLALPGQAPRLLARSHPHGRWLNWAG